MIPSNVLMCSWCENKKASYRVIYSCRTQTMHLCINPKCIQKELEDAYYIGIGICTIEKLT